MNILQFILNLFRKSSQPIEITKENQKMISLKDYLTASGKYPERENHKEATQEVKDSALKLIPKVEALLAELGIKEVKVSSGFRPSEVNAGIAGAAKKSLHMTGNAIDLEDPEGKLDKLIMEHPELLKKHGLWLEHPDSTKGWCHLDQSISRSDRPIRIFRP